jgi:ABC-type amino acid transport system permease subunit
MSGYGLYRVDWVQMIVCTAHSFARTVLLTSTDLLLVGYIFTIALSIATMICGWYGVGAHGPHLPPDFLFALTVDAVKDIPPENMAPLLKSNYATRLLYTIALGFVKTSILVFYMRLDHRKYTRWAIYFLLAFVAALSITTFFFLAFVCVPPSLFWDLTGQAAAPEKCLSQPTQQMFFNLNGICNIIQDISIYMLPIPMLWNLQMPFRQKLALGALFSVGLVAVAGTHWITPSNSVVH